MCFEISKLVMNVPDRTQTGDFLAEVVSVPPNEPSWLNLEEIIHPAKFNHCSI